MKTIIYIRTSTEDQNPENQLKDCLTLVTGDYEVIEEKQSAYKDNQRERFEEIIKGIRNGNIKSVVCWDWDRLFRNRKKLKEFFELCRVYKCEIHSFRQKWYDDLYKIPSPFDEIIKEIVLNLMGWLAEDESKKKSERVKLAVRRKEGKSTKSYKGNKWGRPKIHTNKLKIVLDLRKQGKTYKEISKITGVSIGKISSLLISEKVGVNLSEETPDFEEVQK